MVVQLFHIVTLRNCNVNLLVMHVNNIVYYKPSKKKNNKIKRVKFITYKYMMGNNFRKVKTLNKHSDKIL